MSASGSLSKSQVNTEKDSSNTSTNSEDSKISAQSLKFVKYSPGIDVIPQKCIHSSYNLLSDLLMRLPNSLKLEFQKSMGQDNYKKEAKPSIPSPDTIFTKAFRIFLNAENNRKVIFDDLNDKKLFNCITWQIKVSNLISLSPPDIITLATQIGGATCLTDMICLGKTLDEKDKLFVRAFESFVSLSNTAYLDLNKDHKGELNSGLDQNRKPNIAFVLTQKNNPNITVLPQLSHYTFFPLVYLNHNYSDRLKFDFDYFGQEAIEAYCSGHRVACATMKEAKKTNDQTLLVKAIVQEIFSFHYLLSLFSS